MIRKKTGVVQWETGISPLEVDTGKYQETFQDDFGKVIGRKGFAASKAPLKPGLWNLVVDIRSESHDPCLAATPPTCTHDDTIGHITIPLDFLLYLYAPLHMCHGDCDPTGTGQPSPPPCPPPFMRPPVTCHPSAVVAPRESPVCCLFVVLPNRQASRRSKTRAGFTGTARLAGASSAVEGMAAWKKSTIQTRARLQS